MKSPARLGLLGCLAIAPTLAAGWWFVVRPTLDPVAVGRSAYARGEWDEAARLADRRLKGAPTDREALRLLARSDARAGRQEAARRSFVRLGPDAWEAEDFLLLATGLARQGRKDLAWNALLAARKADPSQPEVLEQLARLSMAAGRLLESAGFARRLASLPRWDARGSVILADALRELDDPGGESEALGRALRVDPALAGSGLAPDDARKRWARSLLRLGRPAEARQRLGPRGAAGADREVAWILSRAFLQEGAIPEAIEARSRARGLSAADPNDPEPAPFVGAARCASCHAEIHRAQRASRHASTLGTGPDLPRAVPPAGPIADPTRPGTVHSLRAEAGKLLYESSTGARSDRALVDYAFGSGGRGRTFVGVDAAGQARELRLSEYAGRARWDLTTGQDPHPSRPIDWLGRPVGDDELRRCLDCHATRTILSAGRPAPDTLDRGIGCERCHGPGGNHLDAVAANFPDPAIVRLKRAPAAKVVGLCGECHSPPADSAPPSGPEAARFQAAGLTQSPCYRESRGGLSCTTCHDPHRDAERSASFYEAKCRSCHEAAGPSGRDGTPIDRPRPAPCKVNPTGGCIGCHMPRVEGAMRHSSFSDHHIRVHRTPPGGN